jgi:hypothetical protein
LFAAGASGGVMTNIVDMTLALDAHAHCVRKLGARVTEELFVETLRVAAGR